MALTTYRSLVAINTIAKRNAAYERLSIFFSHLSAFNLNCTRVQHMPDNFVEIDVNGPVPVEQLDHVGLQGPI